jgi:hypothetical protein
MRPRSLAAIARRGIPCTRRGTWRGTTCLSACLSADPSPTRRRPVADPSPGLKETKDGPRMLLLNISEHSWCQMQLHCRRVAALGSIEARHPEGNPPQLAHGVRFLCSGLSPGSKALRREAAKPLSQPWIRRRGGATQRERSANATTYCAQLPIAIPALQLPA